RHVMLTAVLVCSKPEQHQAYTMLTSLFQQHVDDRVIVLSWLRFELLPVNWNLNRVHIEIFHCRPHLRKHRRPGTGVVHLCPQHEIGSIVNKQSEASILLHYPGAWAFLHLRVNGNREICG